MGTIFGLMTSLMASWAFSRVISLLLSLIHILRQGYDILRETSDLTGIPIVHTTGRKKFLDEFLADGRDPKYIGTPLALETYMHRSWDAFSHGKI